MFKNLYLKIHSTRNAKDKDKGLIYKYETWYKSDPFLK